MKRAFAILAILRDTEISRLSENIAELVPISVIDRVVKTDIARFQKQS